MKTFPIEIKINGQTLVVKICSFRDMLRQVCVCGTPAFLCSTLRETKRLQGTKNPKHIKETEESDASGTGLWKTLVPRDTTRYATASAGLSW